MIFVTTGTTVAFDQLIMAVDKLAMTLFKDKTVVCQIGNGDYIPKHCQYFRFKPNLDEYFAKTELLIAHGGTGSTMQALVMNKPFLIVTNANMKDNHQEEFLEALSRTIDIPWVNHPDKIEAVLRDNAFSKQGGTFELPFMYQEISDYICQ